MDFSCNVPYFEEKWKIECAELYTLHPIPLYHEFADATMPHNYYVNACVLYV